MDVAVLERLEHDGGVPQALRMRHGALARRARRLCRNLAEDIGLGEALGSDHQLVGVPSDRADQQEQQRRPRAESSDPAATAKSSCLRQPRVRALGADEFGDEGLGRPLQQIVQRTALGDTTVAHQHDLVGEPGGLVHVVRDQHDGPQQARKDDA